MRIWTISPTANAVRDEVLRLFDIVGEASPLFASDKLIKASLEDANSSVPDRPDGALMLVRTAGLNVHLEDFIDVFKNSNVSIDWVQNQRLVFNCFCKEAPP